jgi:hypothetical protein
MRKCEKCSGSTDKPIRVVVERKMVDHPNGTKGSQIVREINICPNCISVTPEAHKPEKIIIEPAPKKAEPEGVAS